MLKLFSAERFLLKVTLPVGFRGHTGQKKKKKGRTEETQFLHLWKIVATPSFNS